MQKIIVGLGDGGGNMTVQDARVFARRVELLRGTGMEALSGFLEEETRSIFLNTAKPAMEDHLRQVPGGVKKASLALGDFESGTGQDPLAGEAAMNEALKDGRLAELLMEGNPVSVKLNLAFGQGGTSLGGGLALAKFCRDQLKLLTLPVITTSSVSSHQVNFERGQMVEAVMGQFDAAGISCARLLTDKIFEREDLTPPEAFAEMDRLQAQLLGPVVRLFSQPSRFDYMDLMRRLYWNGQASEGAKSWLMSSAQVHPGASPDDIASQLLNTDYFDFDLSKAGGAALIVEGKLSGKTYAGILSSLMERLNSEYKAANNGSVGNPNLFIKDVWLPGSESVPTIGLWFATHNGLPDVSEIPKLPLAQRMGRVLLEEIELQTVPAVPTEVAVQAPTPVSLDPQLLVFKDQVFAGAASAAEISFTHLLRQAESGNPLALEILGGDQPGQVLRQVAVLRQAVGGEVGYVLQAEEVKQNLEALVKFPSAALSAEWKQVLLQALQPLEPGVIANKNGNGPHSPAFTVDGDTTRQKLQHLVEKDKSRDNPAWLYYRCYLLFGDELYKSLFATSSSAVA